VFRSELERARGDFTKFTGAIKTGLQTLGVGASVTAFAALVKSAVSAGSAINDMGVRLGISTDKLQALQHTARQSGADVNDLEMGLRKLNVTMAAAANDNAEARETLARLGLSWRTTTGETREAGDAIEEFAQRFGTLSESMKADIFEKIFGRAKGMRNVLDELGKKGFGAVEEGAKRAGQILDSEMVKKLDAVGDKFDEATQAIKVGFMKAVVSLEEPLLALARGLEAVGQGLSKAADGMALVIAKVAELRREWFELPSEDILRFLRGGGPSSLQAPSHGASGTWDEEMAKPPAGPPPPNTAALIAAAQARASEIENRINVTRAQALAAQQGPNAAVDRIKLEIDFSQRLLIARQNEIAAIMRLTLTDSGRADLAVKSGKIVADATIEQIKLYEQLDDALEAAFLAQAALAGSFEGEAAVAERDIAIENERADAIQRSVLATKDLIAMNDALASQGGRDTADEVAGFGMLAAAPKGGQEDFLKRGQVLADFNKEMRAIAISSKTMGMEFDSNTAKIAAMQSALLKFAQDGVDPTDEAVVKLSADLAALKLQQSIIGDIFGALKNAVDTSVQGIILGTITLKEAFRNMGQSIAVSLVQSAVDRGLKILQKAIEDFVDWLVTTGLIRQAAGFVAGLATSAISSSATTGAGGDTFNSGIATASGGVFYGAQKRLIAEAGPEAVIPLEGGAVPVKFVGGARWEQPVPVAGYARGGDTIIINNNAPAQVTHNSSQAPDGRKIHTFVVSEVNRGIEGGEFDKAMGMIYGVKRQPVAR